MTRKGKRRREAQRLRRRRSVEERAQEPAEEPPAPPTGAPATRSLPSAQRRSPARKGATRRTRFSRRLRLLVWPLLGFAIAAGIGFAAFALTRGDGGPATGSVALPTPDPRVAGQSPAAYLQIEANDQGQATNPTFSPSSVTAKAGTVTEIVVKNVGSVNHNLRVSGPDMAYETGDDFVSSPGAIPPGSEGRVLVRIDKPGTYPFRCDFHPDQQLGSLVLQ